MKLGFVYPRTVGAALSDAMVRAFRPEIVAIDCHDLDDFLRCAVQTSAWPVPILWRLGDMFQDHQAAAIDRLITWSGYLRGPVVDVAIETSLTSTSHDPLDRRYILDIITPHGSASGSVIRGGSVRLRDDRPPSIGSVASDAWAQGVPLDRVTAVLSVPYLPFLTARPWWQHWGRRSERLLTPYLCERWYRDAVRIAHYYQAYACLVPAALMYEAGGRGTCHLWSALQFAQQALVAQRDRAMSVLSA